MVSGEHDQDYQEVQSRARALGLISDRGVLAAGSHVELRFAMRMRRENTKRANIVINNEPCEGRLGCDALLPTFLDEGAELTVHAPNAFKKTYRGGRA